jgi:predicted ATPase/DNA-binding winged helix-turn-helix (wHTH) protein
MLVSASRPTYASGDCEVDLDRRELRVLGAPEPVGGRAFEILELLVRSAGELVTKDELMERVWPGAVVLDNTLQVHIASLRRALGPHKGLLKTESGRGYRLLGDWTVREPRSDDPPSNIRRLTQFDDAPTDNFPVVVSNPVGRAVAARLVRDLISAYRVVTLTGPGGIGKTTLAIEAARGVLHDFKGGGWFVELASLNDAALVPSAVARALDLKLIGGASSSGAVARAIGEANLLLVLDNCEHVIDAAAELAEAVVHFCPWATVLATSREALRIDGEQVYRVPPLDVPAAEQANAEQVLRCGAVELLIARTRALDSSFSPAPNDIPSIAAICQQLDGIPLAIEFAAARVATLGVRQVAAGLSDRFQLLTSGRRTALPRHQTLRAALDWSYELLTAPERAMLLRLAVFAGFFDLSAARGVATSPELSTSAVIEGLSSLVEKSLVAAEVEGTITRYRLLDTTRAYAFEKLGENGERERRARQHAEYYRDVFERAEVEWKARPTTEWLTDYGWQINNLRAALDWAFSPSGDAAIGVALATAAAPLWMRLSLMDECRSRVEQALATLGADPSRDTVRRVKLYGALATSLNFTRGQVQETVEASRNALAAAEKLDDTEYRLQALYGLWNGYVTRGDVTAAMDFARRFHHLANERSHATDILLGDRMLGSTLHFNGEQTIARHHLETMLNGYVSPVHQTATMLHQFDQRIAVRALLARICWLQGFPDQAASLAAMAVEHALALDHEGAVCFSLAEGACPVALFTRDFELAKRLISQLLDRSTRYGLTTWQLFGRIFEAELLIRCSGAEIGLARLRIILEEVDKRRLLLRLPALLGVLAEAYAMTGHVAEAGDAIEQAIAASERSGVGWCLPELLRIKGEVVLLGRDEGGRARAEKAFGQAFELGRRQGSLSWQLRAALSLARLQVQEHRSREARERVQAIYEGFTEGFQTRDLLEARALIS